MKNYTITVNGNVYDVTVEETGSAPSVAAPRRAAAPAPVAAPKAAPVATPAASGAAGSVKIEAGAAGKIFKIEKIFNRNFVEPIKVVIEVIRFKCIKHILMTFY